MRKTHPRDVMNMPDEDVLNLVISDFKASDSHLAERLADFTRYYSLYRGKIPQEKVRPHGANLFVPYTYSQIETMVPKWYNSLFGAKPYGVPLPVGDGSPEKIAKAKKMQDLLDYQLDQKINISEKGNIILKDVAIFGTCFSKQTWRTIHKNRKVRENVSVMGITIPKTSRVVSKKVKVADDPHLKVVSVFNFRFDPTADSIKAAGWCGEYDYIDVLEVQERIENEVYKSTPELKEYIKGMIEAALPVTQPGYQYGGIASKKDRAIEVMEYHTDDAEVHVLDKKFIVVKRENPFHHGEKPYARWAAVLVRGEMLGIGIPEIVESLQEELNTTRNQRIDNISMALNRMWKARRNSNITADQLISKPNGIIWVDEMEDVDELKMDNVTGEARYHEEIIKKDIDEATGILDTMRGTSTDRRETATTASLMNQAGGDRLKASTILLDVCGLGPTLNQLSELNQQFVTEDTYINVFGDDTTVSTMKITPDDMIGRYEIAVSSAGTDPAANKEVVRNQLTTLYQQFSQIPFINQPSLVRRIFEAYDLKNVDELIMEQPPAPQTPQTPQMGGGMMPNQQMAPPQMMQAEPTPENIQMIMQAFETGEEIPPELIPLAEVLLEQMKQEEGAQ